ncbi:hypothetical protein Ancab_028992 [Ancistrocladus abbreviatus]
MEGGNGRSEQELHVVLLPWLAMGHLIPFLNISKRLASKGIRISFISTPKNLQTLHTHFPLGPSFSLINLIPISLSAATTDLPESSMDIDYARQPLLKSAFDSLQDPVADFLRHAQPKPHSIIFDFTSPWIPSIAASIGASSVYFGLFNASTLSFFGPPAAFLGQRRGSTPESFTVSPDWIPFQSNIVYRLHEVNKFFKILQKSDSTDSKRFAGSISGSDFVLIRSSPEFESKWIQLLSDQIYRKPVIPAGFLFPAPEKEDIGENWGDVEIKKWLDKQRLDTVLYVALGTEGVPSQDELTELAHGLEDSGLPFLWVLRNPPESGQDALKMLPKGFKERVEAEGQGFLCTGWVPQVKILGHAAIRGFLTHCGWNSVIEGLGFGRVLVLLPMVNDQGLVARLLEERGLGVEVPRSTADGSFARGSVVETVRLAMFDGKGEALRENARRMKDVVGTEELNDRYVESFVRFLKENRTSHC